MKPFRAQCPLCAREYFPRWSGIRTGVSLTCGCSSSQVSTGQRQIRDFIASLGLEVELEHEARGLSYDVWVPSKNLAIEFNGLKWHSRQDSRCRDVAKYGNALACGLSYLMIYEDEWKDKQDRVQNLIRNRLGCGVFTALRPLKCDIVPIPRDQADKFYEKYHYIGAAIAPKNFGAIFEEQLVACCSFKRPTRQSKHPWELVRMCSHPNFRVHGIWSKLLGRFVELNDPTSIVSFSDNRLFDGEVYEKIGFRLDGEVAPDYYWVRGCKRHHKSTLRKTKEEKMTKKTEVELREAQGFKRIWDLGKKRWVWGDDNA
jgi:hypothetical protein